MMSYKFSLKRKTLHWVKLVFPDKIFMNMTQFHLIESKKHAMAYEAIDGILLHSDLNPALHIWLSARFSVVQRWYRLRKFWAIFEDNFKVLREPKRSVGSSKTVKLCKNIAQNFRNRCLWKTENQAKIRFVRRDQVRYATGCFVV